MADKSERRELISRMARMVAWKKQIAKARTKARDRASEQLDTMPHAISTASDYSASGKGGILTHRYHKTRLTEAARLRAIAHGGADDD